MFTLEYIKTQAKALKKSEDIFVKGAGEFLKGRDVKIIKAFWNGQPHGGKSWKNKCGQVLKVEDVDYYNGKVYLHFKVQGYMATISLDEVEVLHAK